MTPSKELVHAQLALATIADALGALRVIRSPQYENLRQKIKDADMAAEEARSFFADSRRLQETCDRAGLEVTAVLRRAHTEGLL